MAQMSTERDRDRDREKLPGGLGSHYVFGRKDYPKPLQYVGTVSGDELKALGQEKEAWVELVAFPEAAVIHVIGDRVIGGQAK